MFNRRMESWTAAQPGAILLAPMPPPVLVAVKPKSVSCYVRSYMGPPRQGTRQFTGIICKRVCIQRCSGPLTKPQERVEAKCW